MAKDLTKLCLNKAGVLYFYGNIFVNMGFEHILEDDAILAKLL